MKTVLLLLPKHASFLTPLKKTFKDLGWYVKFYDYRKGSTSVRILRFLPFIGGRQIAQKKINEHIISINRKFKPKIILTVKGETLEKQLLKKIKNKNNKLVNWFPDPMNLFELADMIAPYYDYFFHFDPLIVRKLKNKNHNNVFYLPFASDLRLGKKVKKVYDVSFVGTYSIHREKILSTLTSFDLNIFGDPRWAKSKLSKYVLGGRVRQSIMKNIIKQTKININIHYNAAKEGANLRNFEVTGCGGFLLSDYVKDLRNLYTIGTDMIIYKNTKDLNTKIKYFLRNTEFRRKIAQSGFNKAKKMHTYKLRVKQMLERINEKP